MRISHSSSSKRNRTPAIGFEVALLRGGGLLPQARAERLGLQREPIFDSKFSFDLRIYFRADSLFGQRGMLRRPTPLRSDERRLGKRAVLPRPAATAASTSLNIPGWEQPSLANHPRREGPGFQAEHMLVLGAADRVASVWALQSDSNRLKKQY